MQYLTTYLQLKTILYSFKRIGERIVTTHEHYPEAGLDKCMYLFPTIGSKYKVMVPVM